MVKESLSRASMVEMVTEHKKRLLLFVLETSTLVPLFPARSFRGPFFIGLAFLTTTRASPLVQGHNNQIADDSGPAKALILLVRRTKVTQLLLSLSEPGPPLAPFPAETSSRSRSSMKATKTVNRA
ncbi:MAG: hypothetical protein L6R39_005119 [Caloplaca ligustica]|nr:MAG: hypothetical protein L6R39_005119 [Caloplaca ligustica]